MYQSRQLVHGLVASAQSTVMAVLAQLDAYQSYEGRVCRCSIAKLSVMNHTVLRLPVDTLAT